MLPDCTPRSRDLLETLSFRLLQLGPGGAEDTNGVYTKYLDDHGLEALVVRPDFYVFGGISQGEDINHVLGQLHHQLYLR